MLRQIVMEIKRINDKYPSWRFGQIIANAVREYDGRVNCDPFYIENGELLEALKRIS